MGVDACRLELTLERSCPSPRNGRRGHLGALFGKAPGDAKAQSLSAPGDERDFTRKRLIRDVN